MGLWSRLTASRAEQEAAELQSEATGSRICDCAIGDEVEISGTVSSVTFRPAEQTPALEIELYDGTGRVHVIWLGRRRIPGIGPGRRLTVCGRLTSLTSTPTMFNPRYELKPSRT